MNKQMVGKEFKKLAKGVQETLEALVGADALAFAEKLAGEGSVRARPLRGAWLPGGPLYGGGRALCLRRWRALPSVAECAFKQLRSPTPVLPPPIRRASPSRARL